MDKGSVFLLFVIESDNTFREGNRASNLKVASSTPGRVPKKLRCVLGQGTSPYLPRGNIPVLTVSRSG